jgi:hypothetical protein
VLTKICSSAYPVKIGNKRRAPVTSDSEMFVLVQVRSSALIFYLFFCSEILETPTKHKKAKMAERPSPGSPEFEDLPPVTISYVFLSFFLFINNFHVIAVIRPGK